MRRRDFIGIFGSAAAWPLVARAQQPTIPTVGYVHSDSPQTVANLLAAFREGLSEIGYIGAKRSHRIPVGTKRSFSNSGIGGRSRPPPGSCHRCTGQLGRGPRG